MLKVGSSGDEVSQFQAFLHLHGFLMDVPDGEFGPATQKATEEFQRANGLEPDGIVGNDTYKKAYDLGFRLTTAEYRLIPSKSFTPAQRGPGDVTLIVIHTTEGPETPRRSEDTARWFQQTNASAHYIADPAEVTQSVREQDIAWHAGHKATNARSIGIEHCGRASQTPEEWADDASIAELARSAKLSAEICKRYNIPLKKLSLDELKAGEAGFCGHVDVTNAFNGGSGHHDPGPNWDWANYLGLVQKALELI